MFIYTSLILQEIYVQIAIIFRNAPNIKCYHLSLTNTRPLSGKANPESLTRGSLSGASGTPHSDTVPTVIPARLPGVSGAGLDSGEATLG